MTDADDAFNDEKYCNDGFIEIFNCANKKTSHENMLPSYDEWKLQKYVTDKINPSIHTNFTTGQSD